MLWGTLVSFVRWIALALALVVVGVAGTAFARFYAFVGAPSREEAEATVVGELIAWDADEALAAFESDGRIFLDRVVIDRSPHLDFPSLPRWRRTGDWFSIPAPVTELVSAGIAPSRIGCGCHDRPFSGAVVVFGQVTSEAVAFIAVQGGGGVWERHSVSGGGFIIWDVDAVAGRDLRLRLLRADGSQISEVLAVQADG